MVNLTSSPIFPSKDNHPNDDFAITIAPLSMEEAYKLADDVANGAVVVMSGTVRNQTDGKPVEYLEYQAYQPMAIAVFNSIDRLDLLFFLLLWLLLLCLVAQALNYKFPHCFSAVLELGLIACFLPVA